MASQAEGEGGGASTAPTTGPRKRRRIQDAEETAGLVRQTQAAWREVLSKSKFEELDPDSAEQERAVAVARAAWASKRAGVLCPSLKTLSHGEWLPEERSVLVTQTKNQAVVQCGVRCARRKGYLLSPEEACYQVSRGAVELFFQGLPLSVQESHGRVLCDVAAEHYQVYCHLRRVGYLLRRPPAPPAAGAPTTAPPAAGGGGEGNSQAGATQPLFRMGEHAGEADTAIVDALGHALRVVPELPLAAQGQGEGAGVPVVYHAFRGPSMASPDFRISVCRHDEPMPPLGLLQDAASGDTALKIAVVAGGDVSFYGVMNATLPTYSFRL